MMLTVMTRSMAIETIVHQDFLGLREGAFCSVSDVGRRRRGVDSWASGSSLWSVPSDTPLAVVGPEGSSRTASSLVSCVSPVFVFIFRARDNDRLPLSRE